MIDLVFGIILGTFSEMREAERLSDNDKIKINFFLKIKKIKNKKNNLF